MGLFVRLDPVLDHLIVHGLFVLIIVPVWACVGLIPSRIRVVRLPLVGAAQLPAQVSDGLVVGGLHREHFGNQRRDLRSPLIYGSSRDTFVNALQLVDYLVKLEGYLPYFTAQSTLGTEIGSRVASDRL